MNITREDVLRVAELANLDLTEAEIEIFGGQLASILSYCEKLNELDTSNVEPLAQVLATTRPEQSDAGEQQHLRDDVARDAQVIGEVIRRAPDGLDSDRPYFRVPKVIER
jgi:aspartyl-tRNA(Asn)/glutamyl-tRNA(Gln) amidotransferase subunit C